MRIEISITLEPDTSLERGQEIREELLDAISRRMNWWNQKKAIIGSSLEE